MPRECHNIRWVWRWHQRPPRHPPMLRTNSKSKSNRVLAQASRGSSVFLIDSSLYCASFEKNVSLQVRALASPNTIRNRRRGGRAV